MIDARWRNARDLGFELVQLYPEPLRGLLAERLRSLSKRPIGKSLDLAEFQLKAIDGRRLTVQASGARVNTPDGPFFMCSLYYR